MKSIGKMTDKELKLLIRRTRNDDLREKAKDEFCARQQWRAELEDTPSIEWNGFDRPGEY